MGIIEAFIIGCLIILGSFIGFMVSVIKHLDKISKEQEKITQYIPYSWLEKRGSSQNKGKQNEDN